MTYGCNRVIAMSRVPYRCESTNVVDVVPLGLWLSSVDSDSGIPMAFNSDPKRQIRWAEGIGR